MNWASFLEGKLLRNGLIATIVFMFALPIVNGAPPWAGVMLAAPFGMVLLMVQLASSKKTKRLAAIISAIVLGGVSFLLAAAEGAQAGIFVFFGLIVLGSLLGLLFILFGIMELSGRSERLKKEMEPQDPLP